MPKLEYFLVAQGVSIDQLTNTASVFNVLDELHVSVPCIVPRLIAISSWNAEEGDAGRDFQVAIVLVTPDGASKPYTGNFTWKGRRHRSIMEFQGVKLKTAGTLRFDLSLNGDHCASHEIDVHARED